MEGWCSVEKALNLAGLITRNRIHSVVELGVFGGRSLIPMAMAMRNAGIAGAVWGVDPWSVEAAIEGDNGAANDDWWRHAVPLEEIYEGFLANVLAHKVTRECRWLRCKSDEALGFFADSSIGLLHQDSNHSELVSCREAAMWRRKIAPGGFWVLDDTDWATQARAVAMIAESGFEQLEDHKTYRLFQKQAQPEVLPPGRRRKKIIDSPPVAA